MGVSSRTPKTLSLDTSLLHEIEDTKGRATTSQRVNQLLKAGLEAERNQKLHEEAAAFFGSHDDRVERRAFQSASVRAISRD